MNDPLSGGSAVEGSSFRIVSDDVVNNNLDSADPAKTGDVEGQDSSDDSPGFDLEELTTNKPATPIIKPTTKSPPVSKSEEVKEETKDKADEEEAEETEEETPADDEEAAEEPKEDDDKSEEAAAEDKAKKRDYTGLPPEVEKSLKKMNNREYNLIAPHVKKLVGEVNQVKTQLTEAQKQLAGKGVPANWYDHPQAYTLSPEYNESMTQYNQADREFRFYQQQLAAIKAGNEYRYITGYDQNGNPQMSAPQTPTNEAEVQIATGLMDIQAVKQESRSKIAGLQKEFKSRYDHTATEIKKQVDGYLNNMEEGLRPREEQRKAMTDLLGPQYQGHPLAYLSENLYALSINLAEEIVKLRGGKQKSAQINNDKRKAGPVTGKINKPGTTANGKPAGSKIKLPNGKLVPATIDLSDMDE